METVYISVDIETSGPSPDAHALLALGGCAVADPDERFYVELRPDRPAADPTALAVSGLSLERLAEQGVPAELAVADFAAWVEATAAGALPVFVALNAPFDWMFVADYLHRYLGRNPFGHAALDLKALFMGLANAPWAATSLTDMAARYGLDVVLPHHALEDALVQARVFRAMLVELDGRRELPELPTGVGTP